MELRTVDGVLKPGGAFKLIATGYLLGAGAIFVPLFVLVILATFASGAPATINGEVVEGTAGFLAAFAPLIMLPFVVAIQSVIFGGLIVFGLWLYQKRRPIRVINEDTFG